MFTRAVIAQNSVRLQALRHENEKTDAQLLAELQSNRDLGIDDPTNHYEIDDYDETTTNKFLLYYLNLSKLCHRIAHGKYSHYFNAMMVSTILVGGVAVGVELDHPNLSFDVLDNIIFAIFALEFVVKVIAEGTKPHMFFLSRDNYAWNCFDFFILIMCAPEFSLLFGSGQHAAQSVRITRITRLMRLTRMTKLVREIPALQVIFQGLISGLKSIAFIMILLVIVFYIWGVLGVFLFRENDPFNFRNVSVAMLSLFHAVTLENWGATMFTSVYGCSEYTGLGIYVLPGTVSDEVWQKTPSWLRCEHSTARGGVAVVYWLSFIIIAALVILSLFVGVITMSMQETLMEMRMEVEEINRKKRLQAQLKVMDEMKAHKFDADEHLLLISSKREAGSARTGAVEAADESATSPSTEQGLPRGDDEDGNFAKGNGAAGSVNEVSDPTKRPPPLGKSVSFLQSFSSGRGKVIPLGAEASGLAAAPQGPGAIISADADSRKTGPDDTNSGLLSERSSHSSHPHLHSSKSSKKALTFSRRAWKTFRYVFISGEDTDEEDERDGDGQGAASENSIASPGKTRKRAMSLKETLEQQKRLEMKQLLLQAWHGTYTAQELHNQMDSKQSLIMKTLRHGALGARRIIDDPYFNHFVTFVIILVGVLVGYSTDQNNIIPRTHAQSVLKNQNLAAIEVLEWTIWGIFLAELLLRLLAEEFDLREYLKSSWNSFDLVVVVASTPWPGINSKYLLLLRLVRLLRILRTESLPQLAVIVNAIIIALASIGYVGVVIVMTYYMFGVLGVILFAQNDPFHFKFVGLAMLTLFDIATFDNWGDVMYRNMYGCDTYPGGFAQGTGPIAAPCASHGSANTPSGAASFFICMYFLSFCVLGSFVMLTLFIGVVTTSMEEAASTQKTEMLIEKRIKDLGDERGILNKQLNIYRRVFGMLDLDGGGSIDVDELEIGLSCLNIKPSKEQMLEWVKEVDINFDGVIDVVEFITFMVNMKNRNMKDSAELKNKVTGIIGALKFNRIAAQPKSVTGASTDGIAERDEGGQGDIGAHPNGDVEQQEIVSASDSSAVPAIVGKPPKTSSKAAAESSIRLSHEYQGTDANAVVAPSPLSHSPTADVENGKFEAKGELVTTGSARTIASPTRENSTTAVIAIHALST